MVFTGFFDSTLGIVFVNRFVNDTCFLIKIMTHGKLKTVVKGHYLDSNKQFGGGGGVKLTLLMYFLGANRLISDLGKTKLAKRVSIVKFHGPMSQKRNIPVYLYITQCYIRKKI